MRKEEKHGKQNRSVNRAGFESLLEFCKFCLTAEAKIITLSMVLKVCTGNI